MGEDLLLGLPDNPKGHYENKAFIRLNDRILSAAGGSWCNPPSLDSIASVAPQFDDRIRSTIDEAIALAERSGYRSWGFKDPRTVLTIHLFTAFLVNPHFVCCFRDPLEVAESLRTRDGFSIKRGLELANIYNQRLCDFMQARTLLQSERLEDPGDAAKRQVR